MPSSNIISINDSSSSPIIEYIDEKAKFGKALRNIEYCTGKDLTIQSSINNEYAVFLKQTLSALRQQFKIEQDLETLLSSKLPHIKTAIDDSKFILELVEDWDDQGAKAANKNAYAKAINFVFKYSEYLLSKYSAIIDAPDIDILKDGSISVNWETEKATFLIIFDNSNISYCYGKNKLNTIALKTAIYNNNEIDDIVALWMRKNLKL